MAASEVSAAAEQNVKAIPPPKQTTAAKLSVLQVSLLRVSPAPHVDADRERLDSLTALTLIRLALVGAWKHYTVGREAALSPSLFILLADP